MDRPHYEGRQQRDHPTYRSRSHDSRQQHSYRQDHSSSRPIETHHPHHPFYRHYLHTDPLRLNIDVRHLNMVVREAATTVAMFHSHSTILERMDAAFLREQVSYLERVIKKMRDAIIKNSGKFIMPPPVTPLYEGRQQRGHPSETYKSRSHDSWQQHSYKQGHSSSPPLETHHTDPLRLDIDMRHLNPVVRETAKTITMYYSHPALIDKMDKTFLRQQVYYLQTVIKQMKHAIIRGSEKFVTPPPMTKGRDIMRRNAALKRKAVAAPEKFPVFEFKKPEEKEEGELDEDEPDSNVISPSAIITPSAIKRMKTEVEKKIEARRNKSTPLMRLPLSPVSEEEESEVSRDRKVREPEDSKNRRSREPPLLKLPLSPVSEEEEEEEKSKAKRRRDSDEEKKNRKLREAKADKDKKREEELLGKALTNALIDMDYLEIILKEEDLIPEIGPF